jgi:anti-sigma-K factor RskA
MSISTHTPRLADLLPAESLGALDEEERRELAAHLEQGCAECEAELRRLAGAVEELAFAAAELPEELAAGAPEILDGIKRRVLPQVAAEPRPADAAAAPLRFRRGGGARWVWLAAAAALTLVAAWALVRQAALGSEIERLHAERGQLLAHARSLEQRVARAESESRRLARTLAIVAAPGVQSVRLAAMGSAHATGRAYVDTAERQAVFYAFGLPALGSDKTYQLWYIDDEDNKTSAGIFDVDAHGKASVVLDRPLPVERIQAWAVTIEPRGGRPQPTGPLVLAG